MSPSVKTLATVGVAVAALALAAPASATVTTVVTDAAGDADACSTIGWDCGAVAETSQAAADVLSLDIGVEGSDFVLDVALGDTQLQPSALGVRALDTTVSLWVGPTLTRQNTALSLSTQRRSDAGEPNRLSATVVGPDDSVWLQPRLTVDAARDRLRFALDYAELARAVDRSCSGCSPFASGTTLWGFDVRTSVDECVLLPDGGDYACHRTAEDDARSRSVYDVYVL